MHQFDYLSVLVSIIIALGISHLLSSAAGLIHWRHRVKIYYPTLVWMTVLLMNQIQIWWVAFYRRQIMDWTFFGFLLYLMIPIIISMLGYLIIPETTPEANLEREYYHNRRWFFGLLGLVMVISFIEDFTRFGFVLMSLNSWMRVGFLAVCITGFACPAKRAQLVIALAFFATLLCHITFSFMKT
jgi:hypothetical protein